MLAECPWCGKRFETGHGGRQHCPHCWAELELPEEPAKTTIPPPEAKEGEGFSPLGPWEQTSSVQADQTWVSAESPRGPEPEREESPSLAPAPWEQSKGGVLKAFVETWKGAALHPNAFFQQLGRYENLWPAFGFGVLVSGLVAFFNAIWGGVGVPSYPGPDSEAAFLGGPLGFFVEVVASAVGLVLGAAILHLCLKLVGAGSQGFGTTFRTLCYASAPLLVGIFPMAGWIGSIWSLAVLVIGLRWTQRTTAGRAAAAVFLPAIAFATFLAFLMIFVFASAASAGLFR